MNGGQLYRADSQHPVLPMRVFGLAGGFGTCTVTGRDARTGAILSQSMMRRFMARCQHILTQEADIGGICHACLVETLTVAEEQGEALAVDAAAWESVHCRGCHCGPCQAIGCPVIGLCRVHARLIGGAYYCLVHAVELERQVEEAEHGWFTTNVGRFIRSLFFFGEDEQR